MDVMTFMADWADRAEGDDLADGTSWANMAPCMNTLFYFGCRGHQEIKNIAQDELWELTPLTLLTQLILLRLCMNTLF